MKVILYLIRYSSWNFIFSALLGLLAGGCGSIAMKTINDSIHNGIDDLQQFSMIVLPSIIAFTILSLISTRMLHKIIQDLVIHITLNLSEKVARTDYNKIEDKKDKLFAVLTHDIYTISNIIEKTPNFLVALSVAIGCIIYLLFISIKLTSIIIVMLVFVFLSLMLTNKSLVVAARNTRDIYDRYIEKSNGLIYGMRELYQHSQHKDYYISKEYNDVLEKKKHFLIKERVTIQFSDKLAESLALLGLAVIIIITFSSDASNHEKFAEVLTLSLFIIGPLTNITNFIKSLKPFNASINQIKKLGLELDEIIEDENSKQIINPNCSLEFQDIEFVYPPRPDSKPFSIGPISLKIEPGTITFITGGNGSGKTTFGKILTGLYHPTSGIVKCDGKVIDPAEGTTYRDLFSVIWNDNYTFENVNYTKWQDHPYEELLKRMSLQHATKLENGVFSSIKLSSGQLKRLALVSVLLENRQIMFFDEWAANQDIEFKEMFYTSLLPELKASGKTIIAITHDETFFHHSDRVIKLIDGKLVSN